jgi:hypothetical protein
LASKVYYKIDLKEVFTRLYGDKSKEWKSAHRKFITDAEFKNLFGVNAIDSIRNRTENENVDMKGQSFPKYSNSYIKSFIFSLYSKSPTDVNLKLTGGMLASLNTILQSGTKLAIEVLGEANDRAHGHMFGIKSKQYGKVKRQFLGLPKEEENKILKNLFKDIGSQDELDVEYEKQIGIAKKAQAKIESEVEEIEPE